MNRGNVVRVQLPRPAGQSGSEQYGLRPAIVVQSDKISAGSSVVMIVPMTSNLAAARFPGAFVISPTQLNGLTTDSVVLTNQLRAIDRQRIQEVIGRLTAEEMASLESRIRNLLGL